MGRNWIQSMRWGLALEKSKASEWTFYQIPSKSVWAKIFTWDLYCYVIVGSGGPGPPSGWLSLVLFNYQSSPMCFHPQEEMKKGWMHIRCHRLIGRIAGLVACFVFPWSGRWAHLFVLMVVGFEVWEWRSLDIFIMETRRVLEITATAKYEKAH